MFYAQKDLVRLVEGRKDTVFSFFEERAAAATHLHRLRCGLFFGTRSVRLALVGDIFKTQIGFVGSFLWHVWGDQFRQR